jgi:hypothetical protein
MFICSMILALSDWRHEPLGRWLNNRAAPPDAILTLFPEFQ